MSQHAVIVEFRYGLKNLDPLREVERRLEAAIANAGVGEYDGDELAVDLSEGFLYMYGADADALFAVVRPILESAPFMRGAVALVRYGPPGATGSRVILDNGQRQ
jgi:hypothetical protein